MIEAPLVRILEQLSTTPGIRVDDTALAELTTLRLGGSPRATVRCATREAVVSALKLLDGCAEKTQVLIVGGGSNLVVADGPLNLVAVVLENDAVEFGEDGLVEIDAGACWDEIVERSVELGFGGIECLSGIPGSAGATPVQNVGAYGAEIADVLTEVLLYERDSAQLAWQPASSLDLAYRYSNLKFTQRAVVLALRIQLTTDGLSAPLRFGQLAGEAGQRRAVAEVREEVLSLRRGKGMVLAKGDHDTWSAGSFFTNPIVPELLADQVRAKVAATRSEEEAAKMSAWPTEGGVKLSAAWLIERAGFPRGYPGEGSPVRVSTKHTLALTNRGGASTADLVALAQEIRDGVFKAFGVELVPEPVWVGVQLPSLS